MLWYHSQIVKDRVVSYLLSPSSFNIDIHQKLLISEQYHLPFLMVYFHIYEYQVSNKHSCRSELLHDTQFICSKSWSILRCGIKFRGKPLKLSSRNSLTIRIQIVLILIRMNSLFDEPNRLNNEVVELNILFYSVFLLSRILFFFILIDRCHVVCYVFPVYSFMHVNYRRS